MPLNTARIRKATTVVPVVPFECCAAKTTPDGKPGTTVFEHCRNVGCVANAIVELLPESLQGLFSMNPALSAGVHDVGKVSPGYELKHFSDTIIKKYAPKLLQQESFYTHHAAISAAAIDRFLEAKPKTSPASIAAASHHGSADLNYPHDTAEILGGKSWAGERRKLIKALMDYFGGTLKAENSVNPNLLAGLTSVADWLGSDEEFFPADKPPVKDGNPNKTACHAREFCGFQYAPLKRGLSFKDIFNFDPYEAQKQFIEKIDRPGTYVLEAPMGMGKTEAALYVTYRLMESGCHHGFYFALPTRLTSDRIHERVGAFLNSIAATPIAPVLAHGAAWLDSYARGGEDMAPGRSWFNPMKRALLYPYAVGTIDQALMGVLKVRHSFVRLFGLAGKVVILDEVHSYDIYTGTLLDELVNRLEGIGCTVIILSATLTANRRCQIVAGLEKTQYADTYPLMTAKPIDTKSFDLTLHSPETKNCEVRFEAWDDKRVAKAVVAGARQGKCIICIANTVARAQDWYRTIKSETSEREFDVGILHSRFPMVRRKEVEDRWIRALGKDGVGRPRGCVLISTQILEQSVDVDADWMISELAPSDMLLQRMGRLWRHVRKSRCCQRPEIVVVTQDPSYCKTLEDVTQVFGKENCYIYDPYVLMRTYAVWRNRKIVLLPSDIRTIIEATYAEESVSENNVMYELKEHLKRRSARLRRLARSAQDSVQGMPTGADDERATTRYSDLPTRTVLLLSDAAETSGRNDQAQVRLLDGSEFVLSECKPDFNATRVLHANTTSIASHLLPCRGNIGHTYNWLKRHFYDKPVVLIVADDGRLVCFKGLETDLFYSPEYGIWRNTEVVSITAPKSASNIEDEMFDPSNINW